MSDQDNTSFQSLSKKEMQVFMDIRKTIYPFNIMCEIDLPIIYLYRILTIDSVKNNKQFLIDQLYNVIHSLELIQIGFDELFYSVYPEGKTKEDN